MDVFESPFGAYKLARWPRRQHETLRAWDAADELLLAHLADEEKLPALTTAGTVEATEESAVSSGATGEAASGIARVLLVNDAFGALSCALHRYRPVSWSDSTISHFAALENRRLNASGESADHEAGFTALASTETPEGLFDVVLIKVPKTTALLEDQLIRLKPHLHKNSIIIAAGMVKHLQKSAFQCMESILGPLTTSLAKKKARLIFVTFDENLPQIDSPYPTTYDAPEVGLSFTNHANVFSREHLDLGARFFLTQFKHLPSVSRVIDLACGNGVLGIAYQQLYPGAQVRFVDESYMAIASTRENYHAAFANSESAVFEAGDGLSLTVSESADLILCNPPFHQQHVVGEQIALGMFRESKRCLASGGELWVVANRHLPYAAKLKQLFGHCQTIAGDKRFVVLRVVRR